MSKKNLKYPFDKLEISANSVLVPLSGHPLETFLSSPRFYEGHLSSTVLGGSGL